MTPEENAKELVNKMQPFCQKDTYGRSQIVNAKQCALIAVNEVIDNILSFDPSIHYWEKVKQEIEKL